MPSSTPFSLIVPVAADAPAYDTVMPRVFAPDTDGTMFCLKAIQGLPLEAFTRIYFTILRKHAERYDVDTLLALQLRRRGLAHAEIVVLDEPTDSQTETVARTIRERGISGAIFIKDADGYFTAEPLPENGIAVFPLEQLRLVDPAHKSYVAVDDMQHVTNIIEKRVVSNLFNAGGYAFADAADFLEAYDTLRPLGHLYLSHLIYAMLLDGHTFRPVKVKDYNDWNIE